MRMVIRILTPLTVAGLLVGLAAPVASAAVLQVSATVETAPIHGSGDAADDPAIWIHPTDPSKSTIIGTDKSTDGHGLVVYDLSGRELFYYPDGRMNNVDVRYNFPLGSSRVGLVGASNRARSLDFYKVNESDRSLTKVGSFAPTANIGTPRGFSFYHSPETGKYFAYVTDIGKVEQWELDGSTGSVTGRLVRSWTVSGPAHTEGLVADDEMKRLYLAQEDIGGIWRYGAEPGDSTVGTKVVNTIENGGDIVQDIKGISIYYGSGGAGYLLAASQGSNRFHVYARDDNRPLGAFAIPAGNGIDAVTGMDGIDVTNFGVGGPFPQGFFVTQDHGNDNGQRQNFKVVPWQSIAAAYAPALLVDAAYDPRKIGAGTTTPDPPDTTITGKPANPTNSTTAQFSFTSTSTSATFACSLDSAAFVNCTSPVSYPGLLDGAHTFQVRASDQNGDDPTPASYTWTVDTTPPEGDTTPPETTITSGPPATSTSTSASFAFTSSEANSTFQCSLDGASRVACTSPQTYTGLSIGSHTFGVWGTDAAGNTDATAATHLWSVGPSDTTAPTVTGTSPAAGATGVAVTANVTGSFSEAMDASTVTSSTFTLTGPGTTPVPAAVTYSSAGNIATLNPNADLTANTTYTATIESGPNGVKDVAGNALATDRTWTFTTAPAGGGTPETVTLTATADSYVTSAAPGTNNGTSTLLGVDNSPVEITYLKFDLSAYAGRTIQSATLQLRSAGSGSTGTQNIKLVADDSWTETGITYSLRPALGTSIGTLGPTTTNTNYNIPLTVSGLTSELGQQLSLGMDTSSSDGLDLNSKETGSTFAPKLILTLSGGGGGGDTTAPTVTGTSPTDLATGVAVTANVTGTFSEAMNASTVTSSTFTLTGPGATPVPAAVTYSSAGNVATLNPNADLAANTTYTATIESGSAGVKDVAGNALATDRTWTFTTAPAGGGTPETVTLTATADSYVTSAAPGTNNGTSTLLGVDNSPVEITYLKFDLSAYAGRTIQSATLQLRSAGSGSTGTQNIKLVADDSWTETGITYSLRPALGTSIGTLGPTTTNTNYNIPLTVSGLTGELGQQLSLGMDTSSSDGLDLNSKETGSTFAPKLILTLS
ncbi:phytase [Pseudarthrobacter sulfonivorans]|uniref:phytase n=1 Tax=Pseudarthrobacter sulfonivorans TaxID=121292 RepID=UPI0009F9CD56|nr:phytase [Pseudarthrobacter sulfonivorans]